MYSAMFGNITPGATVKKTLQMKFSVAASLRTGWKSFASEMLPCTGPSILLWLAPAFLEKRTHCSPLRSSIYQQCDLAIPLRYLIHGSLAPTDLHRHSFLLNMGMQSVDQNSPSSAYYRIVSLSQWRGLNSFTAKFAFRDLLKCPH